MKPIGIRGLLVVGALAGLAPMVSAPREVHAQQPAGPTRVTEDELGQMIAAIGLQPDKKQQRYDFAFRASLEDQQWELSMSAVLSQDGESLWVMAWLDELPKSASDVPRTALLRLLAENDALGNGKFFAYIPNNRRFVLQRVVPNADLTSAKLRVVLQDLGTSVVETYQVWSVANWNPTGTPPAPTGTAARPGQLPSREAANESKFEQPVRR